MYTGSGESPEPLSGNTIIDKEDTSDLIEKNSKLKLASRSAMSNNPKESGLFSHQAK
jgi:hypothetical protein